MPGPPRSKYLDVLISLFVTVLLVSNLIGCKICAIGPFRVSGAQFLFPITYIFGDVFTEVYGYAASRRAIWTGFFANVLLSLMGMLAVALPPAPEWHDQKAFETVFHFVPRIVAASLVAYWCGEFANSFVLAKMKLWTGGKALWSRTIGSTVVGQLVDTVLFLGLAFGGTLSPAALIRLIFSGYFAKVVYETAMTPVTYAIVSGLKRREGIDVFDVSTDFSPFAGFRPFAKTPD